MFHSCLIKFGSLTNLTDARYAAAVYAHWAGFCFVKGHARYIEPVKAKEIIDWLSGPIMVAEIGNMLPEDFASAMEILQIDTVQVNTSEAAKAWYDEGYQVIWEGAEAPVHDLLCLTVPELSRHPEKDIVDLSELSLDDVKKRWAANPPYAIQVTGGDETLPGIRDFAEIDELLEVFEL
jgi:phosphoribosylanthranilate isomerase